MNTIPCRSTCLPSFLKILFLTLLVLLSGCGGGGGATGSAPAVTEIPSVLDVAPKIATVYVGTPSSFSISGGTPPYKVFSSDEAIVSFITNDVKSDAFIVTAKAASSGTVTLTVKDAKGLSMDVSVTAQTGLGPVVPLAVYPGTATMYFGIPTEFTIIGGNKNYNVFSNHPAIKLASNVPGAGNTFVVTAENVIVDTPVTLTVADAFNNSVKSEVIVKPASLFNSSLKVTPDTSSATCNPAICSGGTGVVELQLQFGSIAGHNVRLDAIQGDYVFVNGSSTSGSLTVTTDILGVAFATIRANTNAPTQYAILKATDLTNGSSQQSKFVIAQNTDGSSILSIVPKTATITAYYKGECSIGIPFNYYIFGGTPPYRVVSTNLSNATVAPSVISNNGDGFVATTVGSVCGDVTFGITDATGRTTTATLTNEMGTNEVTPATPVVVPDMVVSPTAASGVIGQTLTFVVAGGTPGYYVSSNNAAIASVTSVSLSGGQSIFTATLNRAGTVKLTVSDSGGKTIPVDLTVTATASGGPVIAPTSATGFVGDALSFLVTGGTAPYTLTVNNPNIATGSLTGNVLTTNLLKETNSVNILTGLIEEVPATFVITDSLGTQALPLQVTVKTGTPGFRLSPSVVAVTGGATGFNGNITYSITGGTGPYTTFSSDTTLATVSVVSGNTFTVTGVRKAITATANVTITVVDSLGSAATATYTAKLPAP